ncbi:MAG TPA: TfoX/Sxy family protein [Myxococcota bacterium]|nr:TfoX/Sxy family protein [Myxococcota bacterium]
MSRRQDRNELVEHLLDRLTPLGRVGAARFFGGHALRLGGAQFAFVIEGVVYLRCDAALARELESFGGEAFRYETRVRTVRVASYWSVPESELDDDERFLDWARRAHAAASLRRRSSPKAGRARRAKRARSRRVTP